MLSDSVIYSIFKAEIPTSSPGGGGGGAPRPEFDARGFESLITALQTDLGESIRIRDIQVTEYYDRQLIDIRVRGIDPGKRTLDDMQFEIGNLKVSMPECRCVATRALSDQLSVHSEVTADFTDVGIEIQILYTHLIFSPEFPSTASRWTFPQQDSCTGFFPLRQL